MNKFLLIALIVTAVILRFYKGPELFFWHVDEDIISLTVKRILVDHRPQLIGFPIPGGIYLGPLFYYIVSIIYFISRMSPFGLPIFSAIFGAIGTFLVYRVGATIFENKRVGFFASLIYCFSFLSNVYSRLFDGLTFAPILALLTYLILYQNIKYKKPKNLLWLGVILLISAQNEGSSLSLIVLAIISWLIYRFKIPKKQFIVIIFIFLFFHLPLLIFDLRHNFFISKSFFSFLTKHSVSSSTIFNIKPMLDSLNLFPNTLSRFLFISGEKDIAGQILPCPDLVNSRISHIPFPLFILAILILGFFLCLQFFKKRKIIGEKIILLHFLVIFGGILIYNLFLPGYFYEWVMVVFFPGLAFLTAIFIDAVFQVRNITKIMAILFLVLFIIFNFQSIIEATGRFGLSTKVSAVKYATEVIGDKQFYFDSLGSCYAQGYMYLFWYFGKRPVYSYTDDMFTPTFYFKAKEPKPKVGVVMVNPSNNETKEFQEKYNSYKTKSILSKKIEDVEVLIIEDK